MGPSAPKAVRTPETPTGEKRKVVRVWLLSEFRVSVGSRIITQDAWRLRKAKAIVKLLALAPGHRLHREQVMDLLWTHADPQAATTSLHRALYVARHTLSSALAPGQESAPGFLQLQGDLLHLCPGHPPRIDVEALEAAAARAHRDRAVAAYRAALDLYGGELLPEDRYEEWAVARRDSLCREYLALLIDLAALYEAQADHVPAIELS